MNTESRNLRPHWRPLAILSLWLAAFLSIIGTGDSGNDLVRNGPDEVGNTNYSARETFDFVIGGVNHEELLLNGKGGEIAITGDARATSIRVSGVRRVLSESVRDAQAHLQQLQVRAEDLNTRALVETSQPAYSLGREYFVHYTITQPDFLRLRTNNLDGVITVETVNNDISINDLAGNVTLTDVAGSAAVNLLSGDISARMLSLPLNGAIDLIVLTGNVGLEKPAATSANLLAEVSSGKISTANPVLLNEFATPTSVGGTLGSCQGTIPLKPGAIGDIDVLGI